MNNLTKEQKHYIIDIAKKSYEIALLERQQKGDSDAQVNLGLHESCLRISSLVHYIAKDKYGIPDKSNEVFHCMVTFDKGNAIHQYSHFVNYVNGLFIDASIEQFNFGGANITFSPYDCNEEYYKKLEKVEPLNEVGIKEEIEAYGALDYGREKSKRTNDQIISKKERGKAPGIIGVIMRILKFKGSK